MHFAKARHGTARNATMPGVYGVWRPSTIIPWFLSYLSLFLFPNAQTRAADMNLPSPGLMVIVDAFSHRLTSHAELLHDP
ncbi:hypothetical protein BO83DRAFT_31218 [Aspergillus eucalypticola CBS 122712]|uniref:Uncharacterized protein n=1 Tax=Aspergillus eucalypticola (strain CBS 122712 / IBT 29274) TaxID=1448314 RepID=A0A317VHC6_ASPEC|nr:uncharacterized protein BO83DRAFT_31218 [Aspergillus eucalypticola CBS 122712]PWY73305.1 hypothetical protein BO83DRAFT_31218 [Aspergillus eucalypticola CBS 122712]